MIEIEKKFILSSSDKERLLNGAEMIGTKIFTDVYYDNGTYDLTKKDWWLRSRDGRFELKIPAGTSGRNGIETNQYEEFEDDEAIKRQLNIVTEKPLRDSLALSGFEPFATMTTTREKYKKDGFGIDIDSMDFGFNIAEIEVMIDDWKRAEEAKRRIIAFAEQHDLSTAPVRGKVLEYLARKNQCHFKALETAWGVKL